MLNELASTYADLEKVVGKEQIDMFRVRFFADEPQATEEEFLKMMLTQVRAKQVKFSLPYTAEAVKALAYQMFAVFENNNITQTLALELSDVVNDFFENREDSNFNHIDVLSSMLVLTSAMIETALEMADEDHAKTCPECSNVPPGYDGDTSGFIRA